MQRVAQCHCGQVQLTCEGDPDRVLACHCQLCQRRTGSVIHVAAWFDREQVRFQGRTKEYTRTGDLGMSATFNFCPECGTSVWWFMRTNPGRVGIGVGCFADPEFPPPTVSLFNKRRHPWVANPEGIPCFAELSPLDGGYA